ncbi:Pre-mRNA cleavage factor Im 25 kDa subunit 1 [Bienertia sinuspersici]
MEKEEVVAVTTDNGADDQQEESINSETEENKVELVDIYPLNRYYFGSKDALFIKHPTLLRFKSNYQARGLRTSVELFKHPHLLLLQVNNQTFNLPGGRLRQGESGDQEIDWEVGECLGMWWRPDFETLFYPYLPPNIKHPKECVKLFLVKLAESQKFVVPKNLKLLAVPLCQVHDNYKTYGSIIAGIPQLLSKYSFNMIEI